MMASTETAAGIELTAKGEAYALQHDAQSRAGGGAPTTRFADWRRSIEDEIERLIGKLDDMDGDADFEANGDLEPSLGFGWLYDQVRGWFLTAEDRQRQDPLDEGDECLDPVTMNPAPILAKRAVPVQGSFRH